jgi:hypothetical protein
VVVLEGWVRGREKREEGGLTTCKCMNMVGHLHFHARMDKPKCNELGKGHREVRMLKS